MIVLIDPSYRGRDRVRRRLLAAGLITCLLAVPPVAEATTVTLDASQDAWMDQLLGHQNDNHGADPLLDVQGGNSSQSKRRALVQFDLSSIPACASVSSAVLQLRIDTAGGSSRTHGVHKVLKPWTESGVTWLKTDGTASWSGGGANGASDSDATASATAETGMANGAIITWQVETDVGAFVANPSSNHGWLVRDEKEGDSPVLVTYDSRDNTDLDAVPPRLVVTYALSDAKCDDANVCTTDSCTASGCDHVDNALPCDDLLFCNGTDTCAGGSCTHSGDPCTGPDGDTDCSESCDEATDNCSGADPDGTLCRPATGECDVADTCLNGACADAFASDGTACGNPSDTDCDSPDTCDGNNHCQANNEAVGFPCGESSDTDCTNPDSCDGSGTCLANHESSGTPCSDDGEICTLDECDASGACTHPAGHAGTECRAAVDDCDMAELCDGSSTACPSDAKQPDDTPCDDGLFCNGDDSCVGGSCSSHAGNVCTFVCDEPTNQCVTDACPAGPQSAGACRTAEKSQLKIKLRKSETSNTLIWKFINGESTSFDELGDPTDTADYTLCVYAGTDPALVGTIDVLRSNSTWVVLGKNKGYKYSDRTGASSGVQKVKLRASTRDRTRALIKGRGAALPTMLGPTGLDMPVTVQLLNHSSGVCWEARYTGTPKKSTATQFRAKQ